jgi:hypothetical protein
MFSLQFTYCGVNVMKKTFLWIGIVLLSPVLLFLFITILLYFPPMQNYAVGKLSAYASEKMKLDIHVSRVNLSFPLDLSVDGVSVIQQNNSLPQVRDTVADIKNIILDVQLMPLLYKKVEINRFEITLVKLNTTNFVHQARVKGSVDKLSAVCHGVNLGEEVVKLNYVDLSNARLTVEISDTVPKDTMKRENKWKIFVDKLNINNSDVAVHLPGDTLQIQAYFGKVAVNGGAFDLYRNHYEVRQFDWQNGTLKYDNNFEPRIKGLDYNHLLLSKINIGIDTLSYHDSDLALSLRKCTFSENSGINVTHLTCKVMLDSMRIKLPMMQMRTPDSDICAEIIMDFNAFAKKNPGKIFLRLMATIGKQDLMRVCGMMPQMFVQSYPNRPLMILGSVNGNMQKIDFTGLDINLPTAFHVKASGYVRNPMNVNRIKAHVNMQAESYDLGFVTSIMDQKIKNKYRVPRGIKADGNFDIKGEKYVADLTVCEGNGTIKVNAKFDANDMSYMAAMRINDLQIHHFMPNDSLFAFSGDVNLQGKGIDFFSKTSWLNAKADIKKFQYGHWNLDKVNANATVKNGVAHAYVDSKNPVLDGLFTLDALLSRKGVELTVSSDLRKADLYHLRLVDKPLKTSMCAHVDLTTNLVNSYKVSGTISDLTIISDTTVFRPADIVLDLLASNDTTFARVFSGNLELDVNSGDGYKIILNKGIDFYKMLINQIDKKNIDPAALRKILPNLKFYLMSGDENPFSDVMRLYGIKFSDLLIDVSTSPEKGLNGNVHFYSLDADSIRLDTINLSIYQDTAQVKFFGQVKNVKNNPDFVFDARFNGYVLDKGAGLNIKYYDSEDKLGASIGAVASVEENGIRFHLLPDRPILGYKNFNINNDNYIYFGNDRRVEAKVNLIADDGTGVKAFSTPNQDALQDLTVSVNNFDLEKIMSILPYAPRMTGMLNGDFHVLQTKEQLSVMSDMSVANMTYEHSPVGNISSEFVYLPKDDGSHFVDGRLMVNENEVMTVKGLYKSENGGYLNAKLGMKKFPLAIINGMVPNHLMGLQGYGEGSLDVKGLVKAPQVNGEIYLDSAYLISEPYGVNLKFDNDPVRIVGSNLLLENFEMYAHNNNPLNIYGNVDFSNPDHVKMNIQMRTSEFQLVNAKQTRRSLLYGNMFVDFEGYIRGAMDNLQMRGNLGIEGNTDIAYILKNSPLNTDDQLKDLVTFTDFKDTATTNIMKPPLTGLNMDLSVSVEEGTRAMCYLNADHSNYVNLEGGGDLRMLYNTEGLKLIGRYTLNNGEMKYALPVIPLKTFAIQNGSYIEFTGDPINPKLNISATERTNSLVSSSVETIGRNVAFDVGVKVTQTLKHMGLEFTLDAPEDMTVKNELAAMSVDRRGKLAVTMLTTGMYLSDGNTSSFSMNSALNSFLQNEISNITGNALKSMDLSLGMNNNTSSDGKLHTDYSFKFAKRFWNNRLNIVIGGKVSSSAEENKENQSFIDNVSFEYRLDQTAMRYVRLFYDKTSNDLLEGRITEYGGGFVLRRKMSNFGELFDFRKNRSSFSSLISDSTIQK